MLGGFQSISWSNQTPVRACPLAVAAACLIAAALVAGPAAADRPEARVSRGPEPIATRAGGSVEAAAPDAAPAAERPPLTRAAARQRVETISPVPWLARFGPVSLEQREAPGE